jgi:hypothetical protein
MIRKGLGGVNRKFTEAVPRAPEGTGRTPGRGGRAPGWIGWASG